MIVKLKFILTSMNVSYIANELYSSLLIEEAHTSHMALEDKKDKRGRPRVSQRAKASSRANGPPSRGLLGRLMFCGVDGRQQLFSGGREGRSIGI
ncbi:hypothetical protein AMTR_s00019p00109830 [Amborella trichopoda]|uniref:Uncharacterized protein n=1 Tax=Amborella trichopoda TaxID=13333 RepID=W1PGL6_AMBTC|nr:hypothetical protein AMTR_s00019p00109830 [Amborella trichopoda]